MTIVIRNGRVVDPSQDLDGVADVLIDDGRVVDVGQHIEVPSGAEVIDASGLDRHAWVDRRSRPSARSRFPCKGDAGERGAGGPSGWLHDDLLHAEYQSAARSRRAVADIVIRSRGLPVRIYPIGTISVGRAGEELADLESMAQAGAIGFSDDGDSTRNSQSMREALEWSADSGRPIMVHCEDWSLIHGGVMHEGAVSRELGLPGIPAAAEEIILNRDIELARITGGWLHVLHVSTARGLNLIHRAKLEGVHVTAEAMPHHLLMTDEWVAGPAQLC